MSVPKPLEHEIRKSRVRINVTYLMSATYAVGALTLIVWLMLSGKLDLALGIFSGVASTTATITAFWFGSRGSAKEKLDPPGEERQGGAGGAGRVEVEEADRHG